MTATARAVAGGRARPVGWALVAGAIAGLWAGRLWLIPARFSGDPNEGWNAIQAMRAFGAGPLYPPPGWLTGDNYPPLSFYLVGLVGRLTGDAIVAGRVVAVLAVGAVAAWVGGIARRLGGNGLVAAALLLALAGTLLRPYLAMNDPQWLAHAVMLAGLWRLLPTTADGEVAPVRAAQAAAIMLLAGLIKHNLVALPLAATMWLAAHHRRALPAWLATATVGLLVAAGGCWLLYGPAFFADVLAAPRRYSCARMAAQGWPLLAVAAPMLIAGAPLLRRRRGDRRIDLVLLLLAIGLVTGVVQQSGDGVDVNADIDAVIALSLAGGVAIAARRHWARYALLAAPVLAVLPSALRDDAAELTGRADEEAGWAVVQAQVDHAAGPVACGNPAFCYWAGRDMGIDLFLYGQHMLVRHDASALDRALRGRHFALVEIDTDTPTEGEAPDPVLPLVRQRYRPVATGDGERRLFVP